MGSVNFVVIIESLRDLLKHGDKSLNDFHIPSIAAVAAALGVLAHLPMLVTLINSKAVKFLLFLYCYSSRSKSSQVEVLWEDHRNDLFINSFGDVSASVVQDRTLTHCVQVSSCRLEGVNWPGVRPHAFFFLGSYIR